MIESAKRNNARKRKLEGGAAKSKRNLERSMVASFAPHIRPGARALILGTVPSHKSLAIGLTQKDIKLRGGSGPQNYGHPRNCFFNIVGSSLGFARDETKYEDQLEFLFRNRYAIWDVLKMCKRPGSLDSSIQKGTEVKNDIPSLLVKYNTIERIVFPNNSAMIFAKSFSELLDTGKEDPLICSFFIDEQSPTFELSRKVFHSKKCVFPSSQIQKSKANNGRKERFIELCVLPSTSPANAKLRPPEKEKIWHQACFKLQNPPKSYICPGCHEFGRDKENLHWFRDCIHLENWRTKRRASKVKSQHGFGWYF